METFFIVILDYFDSVLYFTFNSDMEFIILWVSTTLSWGGGDNGYNNGNNLWFDYLQHTLKQRLLSQLLQDSVASYVLTW